MSEKVRILIVDDNENMLETMRHILQEKGYLIDTANTGREAILKAREYFHNIALLDIQLPEMTGIEVLRTFREKYPSRMNIIITAHANLQNAVDALNLGANAYIEKPIDHEILDQMINRCLEKQQEALKITQEKLVKLMGEEISDRSQRREAERRSLQRYYQRSTYGAHGNG